MDYRSFKEKQISLLGFGAMRFPMKNDGIDSEQVTKMFDYAMENGINYFDTSYIYHGGKSETTLREYLVKRYPRDKFYLANKLSTWLTETREDYEKMFNEELTRCGVDYFDFYLVHSLDKNKIENITKNGAFEFLKEKKEKGLIKHIGFSFHGDYPTFKYLIDTYSDIVEFVQLQINYVDYEIIESDKCYELAKKHGIPVVVMEPVKGGFLADFTPDVNKMLTDKEPNNSIASWAMRYAGTFENVFCVLSGMSNMSQLEDNIKTYTDFAPLTSLDQKLLEDVVLENSKVSTIQCTACDYCDKCPENINIKGVFRLYNSFKKSPSGWNDRMAYATFNVKADKCIECGLCEDVCPQKLEIVAGLKQAHEELG